MLSNVCDGVIKVTLVIKVLNIKILKNVNLVANNQQTPFKITASLLGSIKAINIYNKVYIKSIFSVLKFN